jgi:hypothetical protein
VVVDLGRFPDRTEQLKSPTLQPYEKEQFVEALDRFKKYELPKGITRYGIFWLDNERLVFSSRGYPGWKAASDEQPRIVSYNIITGEMVDSGYRGRISCLNHLGDMLIAHAEKGTGETLSLKEFQWLSGKWGTPLKRIDFLKGATFVSYRCDFVPPADPIYRDPPEKLPPSAGSVTPLLPQHGMIKDTVVRVNGELQDKGFLIKPNGESIPITNRRLTRFHFTYQPWSESYFEVEVSPYEPRTFVPSGRVIIHPIPQLFRDWDKTLHASVASFPSRSGLLWSIQPRRGYWRKQGLFLQQGLNLLRIDDGYTSGPIKASPDGCRIHASGIRGDFFAYYNPPFDIVIDLCKELGK